MKKFVKATVLVMALLMVVACLTACVPSNADKAVEKFDKLDCYRIDKLSYSNIELKAMTLSDEIQGAAEYVIGRSDDGEARLYYFENAKDAEIFFENYVVKVRDTFRWENIDCKGKVVICGSGKLVEEFI